MLEVTARSAANIAVLFYRKIREVLLIIWSRSLTKSLMVSWSGMRAILVAFVKVNVAVGLPSYDHFWCMEGEESGVIC